MFIVFSVTVAAAAAVAMSNDLELKPYQKNRKRM